MMWNFELPRNIGIEPIDGFRVWPSVCTCREQIPIERLDLIVSFLILEKWFQFKNKGKWNSTDNIRKEIKGR